MNTNWPTIITALVALYGAIISTYTLYSQRKEKTRQVNVKLTTGFLTSINGGHSPPVLFLEASNPGHIPVNLTSPGIILPDKINIVFPIPLSDVRFPYDLMPGKSCRVWVDLKGLASDLRNKGYSGNIKLIGFYRDAIGKEHKSKKYKLDIESWVK